MPPATIDGVVVKFGAEGSAEIEGASTAVATTLEGMQRRIEHVGVASAFALTSLAEGGEQGLTRLAHGVAILGFGFGGLGGIITTFVAVAGEQLIEWMHKSADEAKKMDDEWHKSIADMINAGDVEKMKKQAQDLWVGTPAGAFKDGIVALQNEKDRLQPIFDAYGDQFEALDKKNFDAWTKINTQLDAATAKFTTLRSAILSTTNVPLTFPGLDKVTSTDTRVLSAQDAEKDLKRIYDEMGKDFDESLKKFQDSKHQNAAEFKHADEELVKQEQAWTGVLGQAVRDGLAKVTAENRKFNDEQARLFQERQRHEEEAARSTVRMVDQLVSIFQSRNAGEAIKKFVGQMIDGLAEMILAQSGIYEAYGAIMAALAPLLTNPFTAGTAGLAIGVALAALGAALSASASSSGGAGGGQFFGGAYGAGVAGSGVVSVSPIATLSPSGTGSVSTPFSGTPSAQPHVTLNATIIGKDDPSAQRQLLELIARAQRRGTTSGA